MGELQEKRPRQDDIERIILRRLFEKRVDGFTLEMAREIAAIVADERERCRKIAKSAWLTFTFGEIAVADYGNALCEHIAATIHNPEPSP